MQEGDQICYSCYKFLNVTGSGKTRHIATHAQYRRLRSLSTGAYRSNSGGRGAKKRAGAY